MTLGSLKLKWSRYIPKTRIVEQREVPFLPTPKQFAFMLLPHDEKLYGGAASSGKTEMIIMDHLRWMDVPGYRGLVLRRKITEHTKANSTFTRCKNWLAPFIKSKEMRLVGTTFYSQEGGQLEFGYLDKEGTQNNYMTSEFHKISLDEATHFAQEEIEFMNSRIRRTDKTFTIGLVLATNPGNRGHCVPYGDVLTPNGWKDIKEFEVGDEVYTVTKNGAMKATTVAQIHTGYAKTLKSVDAKGFSMICTPNHSVAYVTKRKEGYGNYLLKQFDDLPGQASILRSTSSWRGKNPKYFDITPYVVETRKRKLQQPKRLLWKDYAELMGWFLSEGFTTKNNKSLVGICQMKPQHRKTIRSLLTRCKFQFIEDKTSFLFFCADWRNYLRRFKGCEDKYIPHELLNSTRASLESLFTSLVSGDGHRVSLTSGQYYTVSPQLADDAQELATKLGYITSQSSRYRGGDAVVKTRKICYEVRFKKRLTGGTEILTGNHTYNVATTTKRKSNITTLKYNGPVYCLGIKNTHTFVIRQDGYVWISGNSYIKEHFGIWRDPDGEFRGHIPERPFLQAKLSDNPHVDSSYKRQLEKLPAVLRAQQRDGDWDAIPEAHFKDFWFTHRWISKNNGEFYILRSAEKEKCWNVRDLQIFTTTDSAASTKTGVNQVSFYKNRPISFSDCGVFAMTPDWDLIWLDNWRAQVEIPTIIKKVVQINKIWRPSYNICESNSINLGVVQGLRAKGLTVLESQSIVDKIVRSIPAQLRAERGQIWLPAEAAWLPDLTDELFIWQGLEGENDDQIDVLSMAASHVGQRAAGNEVEPGILPRGHSQLPHATEGLRGLNGAITSHPMPSKSLYRSGGLIFSQNPHHRGGAIRTPLYG